uniref:Armadillo-like n=1 Tax=Schistocephalus solidus TaxID=70667 RepID=A0A0V0J5F6_SCHSO
MFTVRTYLLGTVAALAVGAYWIYRSTYIQRKKSTQGNSTLRLVFNNTSVDKAQHQNEERRRSRDHTVSTVEVEHLVSLLASSNTTKFLKIMKTLLSFTSFRENMASFRSPKTLGTLTSHILLGGDGAFLRTVNTSVLNLLSNLMVDDEIRQYLKKTVDNLFDANLSGLTEEELVAFLRFVGNLALLEDSCPAVSKHAAEIYELLNSKSALVQQQVWTVLLNLSCDPSSLPDLLSAEVSAEVIPNILEMLSANENELILSKVLKFLCNTYTHLSTHPKLAQGPSESMTERLLAVRPDLQLQATLLLPCAPSLSNESIFPDTQRLLEILKNFTEPVF